ncbi:MAG: cyclic nucleotide-binding domain-containing protein [Gammaproteobacteria bacterium]
MDTNQPVRVRSHASDWIPALANTDLFSDLSREELELFAAQMTVINVARGELLIRQDEPADSLYVILQGCFDVARTNQRGETIHLNRLEPGTCVGELALVTGEPRSASVCALEDATVASLGNDAIERIRKDAPQAAARLAQIIFTRLQKSELQQLLYFSDLFKDISPSVLEELESVMELKLWPSGSCLMREGDECDGCYLVVSGRLRVVYRTQGGELRVASELGRGQTAGEMGILTGSKRSASVYAIRDTLTAKLAVESFNRLLHKHPEELVKHFAGNVIKRLWMQTLGTARKPNNVVNFVVIPAGSRIAHAEFSRSLGDCLGQHAPTLYLNSARFDDFMRTPGMAQRTADDPENLNIVRWLNHQESKYRYLVYQADPEPSEWTRRCLRQADRIVLVGEADSSPRRGGIEEMILSEPRYSQLPISLVILNRDTAANYDRTDAWLRDRTVQHHYHACPSNGKDMARLGRLLTGRGVGLVLSGGGARGFAHIGTIRALQEAGIPIDKVGGSSMGSIVAAMAAMEWDYAKMIEEVSTFNYRMDYTFPAVALSSGKNITEQLKKRFGERKIEDLRIGFFCVSTDLSSARQGLHERGLLWKYVRASMAVPGLFPPIIEDNRYLVDGAVFNNMPVDVMRRKDDVGFLIASDVGAPMDMETETTIEGSFSGWLALIRRFKPGARAKAVPSMAKTLIASGVIKSDETNETMKNLADLYLCHPVADVGLLNFHQAQKIAERGYVFARKKVTEWLRENPSRLSEIAREREQASP